ncbi:MAG: DUF7521 family protein [Thermoplasmatota archaeon]
MSLYLTSLSILKVLTVLAGGIFLFVTWKAYLRRRSRSMLLLFAAISLMVLAAILEGAALQVLGFSMEEARLVEAVVTLTAFLVLLYSVVGHKPGPRT